MSSPKIFEMELLEVLLNLLILSMLQIVLGSSMNLVLGLDGNV